MANKKRQITSNGRLLNQMSKRKVRELFTHKEGQLFWKKPGKGRQIEYPVGVIDNSTGYRRVSYKGKKYCLHILVWNFFHGSISAPGHQIDHINRNRIDNRIENLRLVLNSENNMNVVARNKSGITNVYFTNNKNKPWRVYVKKIGVSEYFHSLDDAIIYRDIMRFEQDMIPAIDNPTTELQPLYDETKSSFIYDTLKKAA